MDLSCIVATNQDRLIGNENKIPWYVPEDLQNFKKMTKHKILIMGRTTFHSLPKRLSYRYIAVLSSSHFVTHPVTHPTIKRFTNIDNLLHGCQQWASELNTQVLVAGGQSVYALLEPWITSIHLTLIDKQITNLQHPTYFPIDWQTNFTVRHYRRLSARCIYLFLKRK